MVILKFYHYLHSSIKNHFFSLSPFYHHEFIGCYLCILESITVIHFDTQIVPNLPGVL